eukprot:gb/GFBE01015254.1/.p1 GENE.gb/GFBE01015254.1/~~gb/GFBE01015254.1/.p1  ORF type:complete len:357 (+),score=64.15 gb/GFBE01015254.1/:1-1071(+)
MTELTPEIIRVFSMYSSGNRELDGRSFTKLCKDSDLVDGKCSVIDVDIIFAKAVLKGQRRLALPEFQLALIFLADRRGCNPTEVFQAVAENGGPSLNGTRAEPVRFYDLPCAGALWPIQTESAPPSCQSSPRHSLLDEAKLLADTNLRVSPLAGKAAPAPPGSKQLLPPSPAARRRSYSRTSSDSTAPSLDPRSCSSSRQPSLSPPTPTEDRWGNLLEETFQAYCGSGSSGMDGKTFVKLCKDSGLVDREFSATLADLTFAKAAQKGQRRIDQQQFRVALELAAEKKEVSAGLVMEMVCRHGFGGPQLTGTRADAVRFHDDKSTYTGVHAKGGPEAVCVGRGTATQLAAAGMRFSN